MDATKNLGLEKPALSNSFGELLEAINLNSGKLDGLPLPVGFGSNTQMDYLKLSNGVILMWGHIEHGKNYPCSTAWATAAGWASKDFTVNYPVPLVDANPVVFAIATADVNPDTWVLKRAQTYTAFTGCYLCAISETANDKKCDILVIGRWK